MKQEFSAGVVVFFQRAGKREYLLLHYQSGHWDFPKGHIEPGESKEQAAIRELKEETGLDAVKILPNFLAEFTYLFKDTKTGQLKKKTVYFFIGKSKTKRVTLSFEHIDHKWLTFQEALGLLTYPNAKDLLKKVEDFLTNKKPQ